MKNLNFICTDKLGENLSHTRVLALVESFSPKPVISYHLDDISFRDTLEQMPYINSQSGEIEYAKTMYLDKMEAVRNHTIIVYGFTNCSMALMNTMAKIMLNSDKNNTYIIINNKQESEDLEMLDMSLLNKFIFMGLSSILSEKYFQ